MEAPNDPASFEKAQAIVSALFEREIHKNARRVQGMEGHFDEIGEVSE